MRNPSAGALAAVFTFALVLFPPAGHAVLPMAATLGQQIIRDIISNDIKGQLIGSLSGMGCKGTHIAGLIASADAGRGITGSMPFGMPGGMPGGMPNGMPSGMPDGMSGGGMSMARGMATPDGTTGMGGASMRSARGGVGIANGPAGILPAGAMDPAMMAQQQMGANGAAFPAMNPEQMAQMQQTMAAMQDAMSHPLSRGETLSVFDELGDLGLLTPAMKSEAHDCIMLAPPGSDAQIGAAGAMLKSTILPSLRETRQRLANLTLEEQDQLAQGMIDALRKAAPADREAFFDGVGLGFFPAPVVEKVRSALGGR